LSDSHLGGVPFNRRRDLPHLSPPSEKVAALMSPLISDGPQQTRFFRREVAPDRWSKVVLCGTSRGRWCWRKVALEDRWRKVMLWDRYRGRWCWRMGGERSGGGRWCCLLLPPDGAVEHHASLSHRSLCVSRKQEARCVHCPSCFAWCVHCPSWPRVTHTHTHARAGAEAGISRISRYYLTAP